MAEPTQGISMKPFEIYEFVTYRGCTCIITDIKNNLGFNTYLLANLDSRSRHQAWRHEIERCPVTVISSFTDEIDFGTVNQNPEPKQRFAEVTEEELTALEQKRTAKSTQHQTAWGVQVFRGEFSTWFCCQMFVYVVLGSHPFPCH